MAAAKAPNYGDYFSPERLEAWPAPESVPFMEVLAREDIDEAVHAILFRENHAVKQLDTYIQHLDIFKERRKEMIHKKWVQSVADPLQQRIMEKVISYRGVEKMKQENFEHFLKHTNKTETVFGDHYNPEVYDPFYMKKKNPNYGKVTVPPFCDPLFRRQQEVDEERRANLEYETGKRYSMKEFKEIEKARLRARLPQFTFTLHGVIPKERHPGSAGPAQGRARGKRREHKPLKPQASPLVTSPPRSGGDLHLLKTVCFLPKPASLLPQEPDSRALAPGRLGAACREGRVRMAEALGRHLASLHATAQQDQGWYYGGFVNSSSQCRSENTAMAFCLSRSGEIARNAQIKTGQDTHRHSLSCSHRHSLSCSLALSASRAQVHPPGHTCPSLGVRVSCWERTRLVPAQEQGRGLGLLAAGHPLHPSRGCSGAQATSRLPRVLQKSGSHSSGKRAWFLKGQLCVPRSERGRSMARAWPELLGVLMLHTL